jgi:hypothetical protein
MSKAVITRLFLGAILALALGVVLTVVTAVIALANGVVRLGGPSVVQVDGAALAGLLPWLLIAALVFAGGELAAVASWIAALFNTWHLEDKSWFVALFALGVFSLGWVAMIAYVVAGPDTTGPRAARFGVAATPGG